MRRVPPIIPISDLRQDAAAVLQQVRDSDGPMVITQRGRAAAIMISMDVYDKSEHDRELLLLLARGEKEITIGEGYDLESVMSDADKLLNGE